MGGGGEGNFPGGNFLGLHFSGGGLGLFPRTDNPFTINILHAINHLSIFEKSFLNNNIVNKIKFVY